MVKNGPRFARIDRTSPIPYYYQLQEILKQEIDAGRWKPGDLLPSEAELTGIFAVSRSVTRKALDILEGDGQVYRVKGKGTIAAQPKFRYEAISAAAEWNVSQSGVRPLLIRIVASQRAPAGGHVGKLLGISPGTDVFEVTTVHAVAGEPAYLSQMFLRIDASTRLEGSDELELEEGKADVLAQLETRYGIAIVESQISIEATLTNQFESDLLNIPKGAPVFLLGSLEHTYHQRPVAFSRNIVRSDHFRFSVAIDRTAGPDSGQDPTLVPVEWLNHTAPRR